MLEYSNVHLIEEVEEERDYYIYYDEKNRHYQVTSDFNRANMEGLKIIVKLPKRGN